MLKKVFRFVATCTGMLCGYLISSNLLEYWGASQNANLGQLEIVLTNLCMSVVGGLLSYNFFDRLGNRGELAANDIGKKLSKFSLLELLGGGIGFISGALVAFFISQIINGIEKLSESYVGLILSLLVYILFIALGTSIGYNIVTSNPSIKGTFSAWSGVRDTVKRKAGKQGAAPKILDTSVIIDGRIADILSTGFIEGEIIIPEFVLEELRHIADSSDSLRRGKGRRGLDILNKIREDYGVEIYDTTADKHLEEIPEVDVKLLKLAKKIGGIVMTNDYNLNKVAGIQGVGVLNINELAGSLRPVVLPGEDIQVLLIKEGKENGQAIGYLEDGTMIVVEDGRKYIGKSITATVSSVLQTSAGRMIFAKPKDVR